MRRISWLTVAVLFAGVLGCSSETKISKAKAEKYLSGQLDPPAQSVTCPSGITAKAGVTFECKVSYADGDKGTITVHVLDDKGNVKVNPDDLHIQQ